MNAQRSIVPLLEVWHMKLLSCSIAIRMGSEKYGNTEVLYSVASHSSRGVAFVRAGSEMKNFSEIESASRNHGHDHQSKEKACSVRRGVPSGIHAVVTDTRTSTSRSRRSIPRQRRRARKLRSWRMRSRLFTSKNMKGVKFWLLPWSSIEQLPP